MVILNHLYLNRFCLFNSPMLMKGFNAFALRASRLELISLIRLDVWKDVKSVKSAWSILHSEFKACALPPLEGNNVGRKTNTLLEFLT